MHDTRDPLVRHLMIAAALKLLVLIALWSAFVRDQGVGVDAERAAEHLGAVVNANTPSSAALFTPTGGKP